MSTQHQDMQLTNTHQDSTQLICESKSLVENDTISFGEILDWESPTSMEQWHTYGKLMAQLEMFDAFNETTWLP